MVSNKKYSELKDKYDYVSREYDKWLDLHIQQIKG